MEWISGVPVITSERVSRDMVSAQTGGVVIMHPLMAIQLAAAGDHAKWLRDVEAWVVSRANRQADAAMRKLEAP